MGTIAPTPNNNNSGTSNPTNNASGGGFGTGSANPNFDAVKELADSFNSQDYYDQNFQFAHNVINGMFGTPTGSSQATNLFTQAGQSALNSPQSFNTAAARLRERVGQAANQQRQGAREDALGRNLGTSNPLRGDLRGIDTGELSAYSQGLDQLLSDFEAKRLQGLQIANQSASGLADANTALQQLLFGRDKAVSDTTSDLFNTQGKLILDALLGANKGQSEHKIGMESIDKESISAIVNALANLVRSGG